jgi:hypothetical protein
MILNISALNVTFASSFSLKLFSRERSTFITPGPMIVFLPTFPYVPACGKEKAHGSYQLSGVPTGVPERNPGHPAEVPLVGFWLAPGFKFGRSAKAVARSLETDEERRGVNGRPDVNVPMPCRAQPFTTAPKAFESARNGSG